VIIEINQDAVTATGEPFFLRDGGLLESAWARPQNYWAYGEDDIIVLAVTLLIGIAQNHAFEQGNKRTAFTAALMFLELNGYEFVGADSDELGQMVEAVMADEMTTEDFTEIFREGVAPLE
jgi:death-on-curing protein